MLGQGSVCNKETFVFTKLSQKELQNDLIHLECQQTPHNVSLTFIYYIRFAR
jgi:hypothetical protein